MTAPATAAMINRSAEWAERLAAMDADRARGEALWRTLAEACATIDDMLSLAQSPATDRAGMRHVVLEASPHVSYALMRAVATSGPAVVNGLLKNPRVTATMAADWLDQVVAESGVGFDAIEHFFRAAYLKGAITHARPGGQWVSGMVEIADLWSEASLVRLLPLIETYVRFDDLTVDQRVTLLQRIACADGSDADALPAARLCLAAVPPPDYRVYWAPVARLRPGLAMQLLDEAPSVGRESVTLDDLVPCLQATDVETRTRALFATGRSALAVTAPVVPHAPALRLR